MKELTSEPAALALGYFDSVHLGHRKLIAVTREYALSKGLSAAVATFSNNAYARFNAHGKQVYTYSERLMLLDGLCDYILPMRFDSRMKNCPAEDFLNALVDNGHNIKAFVCGYDYTFGKGAEGDADFLTEYCKKHGLDCVVMPKAELDGERVSTTKVKELLESGQVEKACKFLGEPFMLCGKVVAGRGAGRMFDIPTANLKFSPSKLLPAPGVYGTVCVIDGKEYYSATNVGARPTFGLTKTAVETMIDGFNENIYDKDIKLYFYKFLRPVKKFDTPSELSAQVHRDIKWHKTTD